MIVVHARTSSVTYISLSILFLTLATLSTSGDLFVKWLFGRF